VHSPEDLTDFTSKIASSADLCLKPWRHSVISIYSPRDLNTFYNGSIDLRFRIECRSLEGIRNCSNDLELEIYQSGKELNIIFTWINQTDKPLLWHGGHAVWMDSNTGQRIRAPLDGNSLESLARRLRSLVISPEE